MSVFGGVTAVGSADHAICAISQKYRRPLREEEYESFMILPRCVFIEMMTTMMTIGVM